MGLRRRKEEEEVDSGARCLDNAWVLIVRGATFSVHTHTKS